ncbi:hypothetical protein BDN70DRAFT_509772 [Pholiota conissans]|uniref:Uncharacterized protein n=1 Tax=Pholiota conissans TaxID=109636 RepID=A0A9P5YNV9_9AGAR|nr:hypothetical protein BDN70DRAFT_509772 [Pholiota conissans]
MEVWLCHPQRHFFSKSKHARHWHLSSFLSNCLHDRWSCHSSFIRRPIHLFSESSTRTPITTTLSRQCDLRFHHPPSSSEFPFIVS